MWYVYILECNDKSLYTGATSDLTRRFSEHVGGKGGHYTRSHGARKIVHSEKYAARGTALTREVEIKNLSRKEKLKLIGASRSRTNEDILIV